MYIFKYQINWFCVSKCICVVPGILALTIPRFSWWARASSLRKHVSTQQSMNPCPVTHGEITIIWVSLAKVGGNGRVSLIKKKEPQSKDDQTWRKKIYLGVLDIKSKNPLLRNAHAYLMIKYIYFKLPRYHNTRVYKHLKATAFSC